MSERIVRRFSVTSMVAVPLIVATGVAQTLKLAGNLDDVTSTSWGRTLLVKVAVVTVLVAIGGVSQWLLRNDGPSALKRTVSGRGAGRHRRRRSRCGVGDAATPERRRVKVFTTTLTNEGVIADVTVTPGRVGQNEVHLVDHATRRQHRPGGLDHRAGRAAVGDHRPVPATWRSIGPNHYTGTITLAAAGDWTLQITVEPTQDKRWC